jgi:hypothetical protein
MTYTELKELIGNVKFKDDAPYAIGFVSQTQLSIARFWGGCKYNGYHYTYFPNEDTLIRDDVLKYAVEERKRRGQMSGKLVDEVEGNVQDEMLELLQQRTPNMAKEVEAQQ